jgi:hypothetical protein
MKRANIGAVLNFDLCDLPNVRQIKNPGSMSCIIIRYTYDKNLCFQFWPPGGQTKNQTGPKFGL